MSAAGNLSALIARVREAPSAFYRDRLAAAGVNSVDAFGQLPPTHREELIRDQLHHLPHGTRRHADAGHAVRTGITGSGDTLLVLTWTAADLARERAAGTRLLRQLGIAPGMRVANSLPGSLASPGSLLLGDVIEELGGLDVPLGAIESDAAAKPAWELFDRVQPAVLVTEVAQAERFLAAAPTTSRPWWQGIVWLQRGGGASPRLPVPAAAGFAGWQRTWLAAAEATAFVAGSCAQDRFHPDTGVLVEVVDPRSATRVPAGATGIVAVTTFEMDTPALRFATDVEARLFDSPCGCGLPGATFAVA